MLYKKIILLLMLLIFSSSCAGISLDNDIHKPCSFLSSEYSLMKERYIDFILIRKQGEPDKLRLLDYKEANKFLSSITDLYDYIDCLEREYKNND